MATTVFTGAQHVLRGISPVAQRDMYSAHFRQFPRRTARGGAFRGTRHYVTDERGTLHKLFVISGQGADRRAASSVMVMDSNDLAAVLRHLRIEQLQQPRRRL